MTSFAALYFAILEHEGQRDLYEAVLMPWHATAASIIDYIAPYGSAAAMQWRLWTPERNPHDQLQEGLWELYALSRVSDVLLPFQPPSGDPAEWAGPEITAEERRMFFGSLGMTPVRQQAFCPFFHEVVEVEPAPDDDEPISVIEEVWTGFMLDQLLICRSGVRVRGGRRHIRKEIAERSTLYWTFRRAARPVQDLSHGWGSNSQWRTRFRRDYVDADHLHYNVDGDFHVDGTPVDDPARARTDPNYERQNLSTDQHRELLTNRCFLRSPVADGDLWPYDDTFRERWPVADDRWPE
ncbi:MAG TPA: hypothetical protein VD886_11885 [Herpetosiphonaceae bacterium]|nr:hypothetical protein [Herpetosiphonaceae bacterium]